jgi:hypothetical protein
VARGLAALRRRAVLIAGGVAALVASRMLIRPRSLPAGAKVSLGGTVNTPRLAFLIFLAAIGCGGVDVDDVRRRQQSWREAEIQDYVFVAHVGCFCPLTDVDGIRHEVRDGHVVASVGVATGLPFSEEARTMDDIFDQAIGSAREDPDVFRITYDETRHFIRTLEVDPDSSAEDDGFNIEVRCFSTDVDGGCPFTTLSETQCADEGGTPRDVVDSDPLLTCESEYPGAIGRISNSDRVCCSEER